MAYVLIEFAEEHGGTLAVVHNTWITPRKGEVYWPPYKHQKVFNKSLLKGEPVDYNRWKLYNIKRIFEAYDDFGTATKKAKLAEDTSDLQSDSEFIISKKRLINKPQRYDDVCSSDEENGVVRKSRLPRPPAIAQQTSCKGQKVIETSSIHNDSDETSSSEQSHPEEEQDLTTPLDVAVPSNQDPTVEVLNREFVKTPSTPTSGFGSCGAPSRCSATPTSITSLSSSSGVGTHEDASLKLIPYISTLIEQNKEILAYFRTRSIGFQNAMVQAPSTLLVKLPLESFDDLELFEGYLEDKENEQQMSTFLSTLDRTNLVSSTTAVLRHCISYQLAKELSFLGTRQNKKAFQKYKLKNLAICAVKKAIPSAIERDIENHIKNWLKRAPKNYQLQQERQQKQSPANGI